MKIIINHSSMVPIYEQIMEQIKAQVISGELKESDLLPSVRAMAKEFPKCFSSHKPFHFPA